MKNKKQAFVEKNESDELLNVIRLFRKALNSLDDKYYKKYKRNNSLTRKMFKKKLGKGYKSINKLNYLMAKGRQMSAVLDKFDKLNNKLQKYIDELVNNFKKVEQKDENEEIIYKENLLMYSGLEAFKKNMDEIKKSIDTISNSLKELNQNSLANNLLKKFNKTYDKVNDIYNNATDQYNLRTGKYHNLYAKGEKVRAAYDKRQSDFQARRDKTQIASTGRHISKGFVNILEETERKKRYGIGRIEGKKRKKSPNILTFFKSVGQKIEERWRSITKQPKKPPKIQPTKKKKVSRGRGGSEAQENLGKAGREAAAAAKRRKQKMKRK